MKNKHVEALRRIASDVILGGGERAEIQRLQAANAALVAELAEAAEAECFANSREAIKLMLEILKAAGEARRLRALVESYEDEMDSDALPLTLLIATGKAEVALDALLARLHKEDGK